VFGILVPIALVSLYFELHSPMGGSPKVKGAVRPCSRKGSKRRMERYRIDTIDVRNSIGGTLSMTFKREIHTRDTIVSSVRGR
jgi:hypothetical protein